MQTIFPTATSVGPSIWLWSSEKVIKRCWLVVVLQPVIVLQQVLLLLPWRSFCKHHHSSGNSPTWSAEQPTMAHSVLTAHPFFFALHLLQPGTFITLWIFSRMNFWNPRILGRKQKLAFCWWCFFWWIFRPLTMLINILTNIPLLMNISRYIWIFVTYILLLMDFWSLSADGYSGRWVLMEILLLMNSSRYFWIFLKEIIFLWFIRPFTADR